MSTEWLMQICYFHSFYNTNIGSPYNAFRSYISIFIVLQVDGRLRTLSDLTHLHGMTCRFGACSTIRAQVPYFGDSHVPSFSIY